MATTQSRKDLNKKLQLERKLLPKLRRFNTKVSRQFGAKLRQDGTIININEFDQGLTDILDKHYGSVTNAFSNNMSPRLPDDVSIDENERSQIKNALAPWLLAVVPAAAIAINNTTRGDMIEATEQAAEDESVRALTGRGAQLTAAALATVFLARKLRGREAGVLMTETQIPAEVAKATEAEVLSGATPSIQIPTRHEINVKKEWVTVGDSAVRPAHANANGQRVNINEAFIVGGELLRQPGDTSLGASLGNIINCRCNAEYNRSQIVGLRRAA